MASHTDKQLLVFLTWLEEQKKVPSRADWYAMRLTCEVARMFAKHPEDVHPWHFHYRDDWLPSRETPKESIVVDPGFYDGFPEPIQDAQQLADLNLQIAKARSLAKIGKKSGANRTGRDGSAADR